MTSQDTVNVNHIDMIREELVGLQQQYQIATLNVDELVHDMTSLTCEYDLMKEQVFRLKKEGDGTSLKFERPRYNNKPSKH
jgi:hypothetical protein